ncbi:MAG: SGNH/GDSL hydrolase family protein [Bdellovibrionales bacterium]|nr:SGNH/GDSL hydrolase family protein [Bdellovibrionales bacterium]
MGSSCHFVMIRVILVVVAMFFAFILSECFVRYLHVAPVVYRLPPNASSQSAYQLSQNPILGYEFKPNYRSTNYDAHQSFPFINSVGMRDRERALTPKPGVIRIALLGDSVVAGNGIRSDSQIISSQMESVLGERFEVLNFGVGGYCTRAEVEVLQEKALKFHPKVVVLLFVYNDFINSNGVIIERLRPESAYVRSPFVERAFLSSDLFRFTALRLNLFHFSDEFQSSLEQNKQAIGDNNVEDGLTLLREISNKNDLSVLVVAWPRFSDDKIFYSSEMYENGQLRIGELASKYNFPFLSLVELYQNDFHQRVSALPPNAKRPSPMWSYTIGDGTHPNPRGAEMAAKFLGNAIKELFGEYNSRL